ncbi:hypothetical protein R3P38DRAFT_1255533 [Favolaschia claudopus]|uniref:Secreted protein n=1 Tax=Favolaschia claudopus TaxID=2862362 RepID=A0AAW0B1N1_9AGAR
MIFFLLLFIHAPVFAMALRNLEANIFKEMETLVAHRRPVPSRQRPTANVGALPEASHPLLFLRFGKTFSNSRTSSSKLNISSSFPVLLLVFLSFYLEETQTFVFFPRMLSRLPTKPHHRSYWALPTTSSQVGAGLALTSPT